MTGLFQEEYDNSLLSEPGTHLLSHSITTAIRINLMTPPIEPIFPT